MCKSAYGTGSELSVELCLSVSLLFIVAMMLCVEVVLLEGENTAELKSRRTAGFEIRT